MSEVKEWQLPVITALIKKCKTRERTVEFCNLLKDTGSLLSGGFVLKAITKHYENSLADLDIYVPYKQIPTFLERCVLNKLLDFQYFKQHNASIYCRSFLRKNGIRRIYTFTGEGIDIDIMSVRSRTTPTKVSSNFDLTICQVWFDGVNVYATHPEHIKNRSGYLQNDYITTFIKGNRFLKQRLEKYRGRGFKIEYDPSYQVDTSINSIDFILNNTKCNRDKRDDEMLHKWMKKALLKYFLRTNIIDDFNLPLSMNGLTVYNEKDQIGSLPHGREYQIRHFKINADDGYDSEELEQKDFIELANKQIVSDIPAELKYGRRIFTLLEMSLFFDNDYNFAKLMEDNNKIIEASKEKLKIIPDDDTDRINGVTKELEYYTNKNKILMQFADYIHKYTRVGDDMFGGEGHLYDFHEHGMEEAITRDSMETYLNDHINKLSDEEKLRGVTCYMGDSCKKITLKEIKSIVSDEYYKKFTKLHPVKTGLNTLIPIYNSLLPNTKKHEQGFGDEFSETMCPFCLEPVSRYEGCSYMTHPKVAGRDTPYCRKEVIVNSVFNKYNKIAEAVTEPGIPFHIEFCVECGRPCISHQHVDITSRNPQLVQPRRVPDPRNPGNMIFDYATCTGGGRVELIARMLAVRKVYRTSKSKDPHKERQLAAEKADKAAHDPKYLKKAQEIFDEEPSKRAFKNKVPVTKKYDDPAYNDIKEEKEEKGIEEVNSSIENDMKEESENNIPAEYENEQYSENNVNNLMWGNREGGGRKKTNKNMFKYIRKLNKTYKLRKKK
jgi:hypothetical protein